MQGGLRTRRAQSSGELACSRAHLFEPGRSRQDHHAGLFGQQARHGGGVIRPRPRHGRRWRGCPARSGCRVGPGRHPIPVGPGQSGFTNLWAGVGVHGQPAVYEAAGVIDHRLRQHKRRFTTVRDRSQRGRSPCPRWWSSTDVALKLPETTTRLVFGLQPLWRFRYESVTSDRANRSVVPAKPRAIGYSSQGCNPGRVSGDCPGRRCRPC